MDYTSMIDFLDPNQSQKRRPKSALVARFPSHSFTKMAVPITAAGIKSKYFSPARSRTKRGQRRASFDAQPGAWNPPPAVALLESRALLAAIGGGPMLGFFSGVLMALALLSALAWMLI